MSRENDLNDPEVVSHLIDRLTYHAVTIEQAMCEQVLNPHVSHAKFSLDNAIIELKLARQELN